MLKSSDFSELWLVTHEFFPKRGGVGVYVEELARAAAGRLPTTVWAPQAESLEVHDFCFAVRSLPVRGTQNLSDVVKTLYRLARASRQTSGVHFCFAEPGAIRVAMLGSLLRCFTPRNFSLILHGSEIQQFHARPDLRFLFQQQLRRARRVGVVSTYNAAWLKAHFQVDEQRLCIVPGTVRHAFREQAQRQSQWQSEQGRAAGTKKQVVLLTVGRIHPRKGQLAVLEALASVSSEVRQRLVYRIVGPVVDRAYRRRLEECSCGLGVAVYFEHELSDSGLEEAYREADIFIMTSVSYKKSVEGLGMVYLEAGAYGLPSIAHEIGGVADAVCDGSTGILVAPENRRALAAAITRLVTDEKMRLQMGIAAQKRALSRTWMDNVRVMWGGENECNEECCEAR